MDRAVPDLLRRQDAGRQAEQVVDDAQYGEGRVMGFPSPATDYVERRLCPETICGIGIDSRILETSTGFAVIEPVTRLVQNQVLLILSGGRTQFARVMGRALITDDGEAIEGAAAEEVEVLGRVTFFINSVIEDDRVV